MNDLNSIQKNIQGRFPRYVAGGVDPNDFNRIFPQVESWDYWQDQMREFGDERIRLAETALENEHDLTAGDAFARAAIYYHFGQIAYFENDRRKLLMRDLSVKAYRRGLELLDPPARRLEMPFTDKTSIGNLRLPIKREKPGVIFLLPGVDSTKEEMYTFEKYFLDRGVATLAFEGPGQGETWHQIAMTDDYERALSASIDYLTQHVPEIDSQKIAVYGRSMGGYLAPRVAALEPRIKATISAGGFYDLSHWNSMPEHVRHNFRYAWKLETLEEAGRRALNISLEGLLSKLESPLLIIHSGQDVAFPAKGVNRMAEETKGKSELVVYEEGTHVCDNITYKYRPRAADWVADQLYGLQTGSG